MQIISYCNNLTLKACYCQTKSNLKIYFVSTPPRQFIIVFCNKYCSQDVKFSIKIVPESTISNSSILSIVLKTSIEMSEARTKNKSLKRIFHFVLWTNKNQIFQKVNALPILGKILIFLNCSSKFSLKTPKTGHSKEEKLKFEKCLEILRSFSGRYRNFNLENDQKQKCCLQFLCKISQYCCPFETDVKNLIGFQWI